MSSIGRHESMRSLFGCTVTFENDQGQRMTLHRGDAPRKALRAMCAIALARDETNRLISYSTPETILVDISGGRGDSLRGVRQDHIGADYEKPGARALPEVAVLAQIGRLEMLHPRLRSRPSAALLRE